MSAEENKALVRRFYEEIDRGNLDTMDELVAEDYVNPGGSPPRTDRGREDRRALVAMRGGERCLQIARSFRRIRARMHNRQQLTADAFALMLRDYPDEREIPVRLGWMELAERFEAVEQRADPSWKTVP
jgi:hypothetical protein